MTFLISVVNLKFSAKNEIKIQVLKQDFKTDIVTLELNICE